MRPFAAVRASMPGTNANRKSMTDHELALQLLKTCQALGMSQDQTIGFISRMLKNRQTEKGSA